MRRYVWQAGFALALMAALASATDPVAQEENKLATETSALGAEVKSLETGASGAGVGSADASLGQLAACQTQSAKDTESATKFKGQMDACLAKKSGADLLSVTQQRLAGAEETQRHKAKLAEQSALDALRDAYDTRKNETSLKEIVIATCDARKLQLNEALAIANANVAQAAALSKTKREAAAAMAEMRAEKSKLIEIQQGIKASEDATSAVRIAMDSAVKLAQTEAAEEVRMIQADIAAKLKVLKAQLNVTGQQEAFEAASAVNQNKLEVNPLGYKTLATCPSLFFPPPLIYTLEQY